MEGEEITLSAGELLVEPKQREGYALEREGYPLRRPQHEARPGSGRRGSYQGTRPQGTEPQAREGLRDRGEHRRRPLREPKGLVPSWGPLGRLLQGRGAGGGARPRRGRPRCGLRERDGRRGGPVDKGRATRYVIRHPEVEERRNGYDVEAKKRRGE